MGLREDIQQQPISELALRPYVAVDAQTTVRNAVTKMKQLNLGAAIIVDSAGKAVGMFDEKKLLRLLTERPGGLDEPVGTHLSQQIVCLPRTATIAQLIATMQSRNLRWVCVVDDGGNPVAMTGLRGVVDYVADYFPRQVKVQPMDVKLAMEEREGA